MKKLLLLAPVLALILGACIPEALQPQTEAPVADLQATVEALASTKSAQTVESLPTPTLAPPTEAPSLDEPTAVPEVAEATATLETLEATEAPAETPVDEEPTTPEATLVATEAAVSTPQPPDATATSAIPTPTSPVIINTPPPDTPRHNITFVNTLKGTVGIYMEGYTEDGYHPIVAYELAGGTQVTIKIPEAAYTVIVHTSKDPMVDYTGIYRDGTTITVYKNYFKITK